MDCFTTGQFFLSKMRSVSCKKPRYYFACRSCFSMESRGRNCGWKPWNSVYSMQFGQKQFIATTGTRWRHGVKLFTHFPVQSLLTPLTLWDSKFKDIKRAIDNFAADTNSSTEPKILKIRIAVQNIEKRVEWLHNDSTASKVIDAIHKMG